MKNFCLDLKEHATKIINYEKREIKLLTREKTKIHLCKKNDTHAKKDLVLLMAIKIISK